MSGRTRVPGILLALVVVAVLVAALAVDRGRADPAAPSFGATEPFLMPVASPTTALGSTWFCPLLPAPADGSLEGSVVVANPTDRDVSGSITVYPVGGGDPVAAPLSVPAAGRTSLTVSDVAPVPLSAATVEMDGPQVVVEAIVRGSDGFATSPCSSSASPTWHTAAGTTTRDARLVLTLFNPFPDDAVVDFTFATNEGPFAPQDLQGFVVPGRSLTAVDVTEQVRRRSHVSASVVARTGRLVMGRLQSWDGTQGVSGLSAGLAMPAAAPVWYFPSGVKGNGVTDRYQIYNPGEREATVNAELVLDEGAAEPFELRLPPGGYVTVDLTTDDRVPDGLGYAVTVRSANDVPVVAERVSHGPSGTSRAGTVIVPGSPRSSSQWVLAAGGAGPDLQEVVTVLNPTGQAVQVSVSALEGSGTPQLVPGLERVEVPTGGRTFLSLGDHTQVSPLSLLVEAGAPVVVERRLAVPGGDETADSIGIPLS